MERFMRIEMANDEEFDKLYKAYQKARYDLWSYLEKDEVKIKVKEISPAATDEIHSENQDLK